MLQSAVQSVVETGPAFASYPELQRARVLITGLSAATGLEVARAFADQHARLVLQMDETDSDAEVMLEILAQTAEDVQVSSGPLATRSTTVDFAQRAAQAYGGLDVVINLVTGLAVTERPAETVQQLEDQVADRLGPACLITNIATNRMRLTWSEGLILNVMLPSTAPGRASSAYDAMARGALSAMTRSVAQRWQGDGIRINAIGPRERTAGTFGAALTRETEIAALAVHLASRRGRTLSGYVFDLDHVCGRRD